MKHIQITCGLLGILSLVTACEKQLIEPRPIEVQQQVEEPSHERIFICYFPPRPTFPGGDSSLFAFIKENIRYPKCCCEGTVFVKFSVLGDGSAHDFEVIKGINPDCDQSALDVVKKLPNWIPAKTDGEPETARVTLPVRFKL